MAEIYYWDSSIFCSFFNQEPDRSDVVEEFLHDAECGELTIITSFMTLTEVLRVENKKQVKAEDQKRISAFFRREMFEWVNFDRTIAELARELQWTHAGLKSKDAVHLASAISLKRQGVPLDGVHSYDGDFGKLSGKIKGLDCYLGQPMPAQMRIRLGDPRRPAKKKKKGP